MMNKYLTIFGSHSQYVEPDIRPNVSYCIQEDEIHYNPKQKLIVRYNVTNASNPTKLYNYVNGKTTATLLFNKVEIDGVEVSIVDLDAASGNMLLSVGEHVVKYILKDPTTIEEKTFYYCTSLTYLTIPDSVTTIEKRAFYGCSGLISVNIPKSIIFIGEYAFSDCTGLTSVHITDLDAWCKITFYVESNPLHYAHRLYLNDEEINNVVIPSSMTSVGDHVFDGCTSLTSVTIPNSVTSIGSDAFGGCTGLTSVTIPNSVITIRELAFENCSNLTSVTIGNSVTYIGELAFLNCNSLTSITIPNSVTFIGPYTFRNCSSLTSLTIGNSVTSIRNYTFSGCSSLTSVIIPNSVTSIEQAAFRECNSLKTIICEGYIENIGGNAFYQVASTSQLETVEFRGGVGTFTGRSVFWGCVNLKTIKYNSNTLPTYNIASTDTPWGSTTATNTCGYTNRTAGTNIFYCPSTSTYTEAEIDPYNNGSLFSTNYSGFTISRTL